MKITTFGALLFFISASHAALAQTPQQRTRLEIEELGNGQYQANVYYSVSDLAKTTGLGLRVHYSSSVISVQTPAFDPLDTTRVLDASFISGANQADQSDHDANAQTDRFINVAWAGFGQPSWPSVSVGETLLIRFEFALVDDSAPQNVVINISSSSKSAVHDFVAESFAGQVPNVNDAPTGADAELEVLEDGVHSFTAADFGFADSADNPPDALLAVRIATLPDSGNLRLGGNPIVAGQSIAAAAITNLTFTPATNSHGASLASFTFQVQDDGGIANGGADLDATPDSVTFHVTQVNDAPHGTELMIALNEDTNHSFTADDFGFSDAADDPVNSFESVYIAALPTTGSLELNGGAVAAGQEIASAEITGLAFLPAPNGQGATYASVGFQVRDNGGTANGGVHVDPVVRSLTIAVSAVNDAPSAADSDINVLKGTSHLFAAADFGFSDVDDSPPDSLQAVVIRSLPLLGSLSLNGVGVSTDQVISASDLSMLSYAPPVAALGADYASFTFQVQDNGGTERGGKDQSATANTITIHVTDINSAPAGTDAMLTVNEGAIHVFSSADFEYSDPEDSPPNALQAVRITSLPAKGALTLSGGAVSAGQLIPASSLGNLSYMAPPHANGISFASISFQLQDDGGTLDGGVDLDPTPSTFTFNVTAINSEPAGRNNTIAMDTGGVFNFSAGTFGFSDINDKPANSLLGVLIVSVPGRGTLLLDQSGVTANQFIPLDGLHLLAYTPAEGGQGASYDSLAFRVQDNGGTANGGIDLDQTANTIVFDVGVVIEEPVEPSDPPAEEPTAPNPEETINDLNDELDSIDVDSDEPVTAETETRVDAALGKTATLAEQVTSSLPEGTAGVTVALSALDTMNKTLDVSTSVAQKGGQVAQAAVVGSLNNVAAVLGAMSTRAADITPEQRTAVQAITSNTVSNSSKMISAATTTDELVNLVAATSSVINAAADAGAELSDELVAQAEQLVNSAVKSGMTSFSADIDPEDPEQVEALLRSNPAALEFAIAASVAVKSRIKPDQVALEEELVSRGVSSEIGGALSDVLAAVANPDGVTVGGSSATESLLSALVQFLTGADSQSLADYDGGGVGRSLSFLSSSEVTLDVDSLTGLVTISAPGERFSAAVVNTRIVSASMPEGISYLRDGRALVVTNGIAIELAPISADLIGFTSVVEQEGYALSLKDNGSIEIQLDESQRLLGVFAYDNLAGSTGSCGNMSVLEPSGAPNTAGYAFTLQCANGSAQRVLPFVHDKGLFRSVADMGYSITTDRNTGIISIAGVGGFKPGFFVSSPSSEELAYLDASKDTSGLAFRVTDINADGLEDVILISATGVQPLYGVTP